MTQIPSISTDRLILRAPKAADFEALAAFYAEPARAAGFGGTLARDKAWRWFASLWGHWALRGYGYWVFADKDTDVGLGLCGVWEPEGWPEPEIGWVAFAGSEGKGLAYEAALAVRDWAYDVKGMPAIMSNILADNARSIALAERLGCTFESEYNNVEMGMVRVYRHVAPEARGAA